MDGTPGGCVPCKDIPNYAAPTGRAGSTNGPGLGGENVGTSGTQGANSPNHPNQGGSPVPWINRGR